VTSCAGSWNGVEYKSCTVEPTLLPTYSYTDGEYGTRVAFCYLLDCTNTDIGTMINDCYWLDTNPITFIQETAGCDESS